MLILLSSRSEVAIVLRLLLLLVNLRALGSFLFRDQALSHTARIGLGLGLGFLAVFVGTAVQRGAPGQITPIILYSMLAAGWAASLVRLWRRRRQLRAEPPALSDALPFLLLLGVAFAVVHADWPRWVPLNSDPQQHAFFARKVIDYRCIPRALVEMGGEPLNYPAGTGVLGYLMYALAGLLPAEAVALANGAFLLLFSLALVEAGHAARLPLAQRCLLALVAFLVGAGGFGAWEGYPGNGKNILFWLLQLWLAQLFLIRRAPAVAPAMMVQFVLQLVVVAELNPMLAVLWAWMTLLTLVVWQREGALTRARVLLAAGLALVVFGLLLVVDPFFHATLIGAGVPSRSFEHLPPGRTHLQLSADSYFVVTLGEHLVRLVKTGPRKAWVLIIPIALILLGTARDLRRLQRRTLLFGIGAALLPSLLLVSISRYAVFPSSSGLKLIVPYCMEVLTLTLWLAAFVLAVWFLDRVPARLPRLPRLACTAGLLLGACFSTIYYGIWPHIERHGSPRLPHMPPVNQPIPAGLVEATRAAAELWEKDRNAKVLLVNWEWTRSPPERWVMPEYYSTAIALLPHANPAFFFYRGSADYSYDNYFAHVCSTWDPNWLTSRGIRWVLLPSRKAIDRRCAFLREAAAPGLYQLRGIASLARPAAVSEEREP